MHDTMKEFAEYIKDEVQKIWIEEPQDIYNIRHGCLKSEAGAYGQAFSPLVMLSGEIRYLGTHAFADLNYYCGQNKFSLEELIFMTKRMLATDLSVIGFFGLQEYGKQLAEFNQLLDTELDMEDFAAAVSQMFILTNRYQMWLHQIFPWGYGSFMPRKSVDDYKKIAESLK